MSFVRPPVSIEGLGIIVERNSILAEAKKLKQRAAAIGISDELASLFQVEVKRSRGRQRNSHSKVLAAKRDALWSAYEREKERTPSSTDQEIAERLYKSGAGASYGNGLRAIVTHISHIKSDKTRPSLLMQAGRPKKRGRPPKRMANRD
jgi:hypothetical protein